MVLLPRNKLNNKMQIAPGTFKHPTINIDQTFIGIFIFIYWIYMY